jgi:hypothetical protein
MWPTSVGKPAFPPFPNLRGQTGLFKNAHIPVILAVIQTNFSAAQTVWRRDRDSNLHYPLCRVAKSRVCATCNGFCNIHVSSGELLEHPIWESSPFSYSDERRTPSDGRTENASFEAPSGPNWLARDCAPTAQSKGEKYLRRICSSKGKWMEISGDSCPCFVTRLPPLG